MSEWIEVDSAFINDGRYLCYVKGMTCCWQEVLTMCHGEWFDLHGEEFGLENGSIVQLEVTHFMTLPEPPKN